MKKSKILLGISLTSLILPFTFVASCSTSNNDPEKPKPLPDKFYASKDIDNVRLWVSGKGEVKKGHIANFIIKIPEFIVIDDRPLTGYKVQAKIIYEFGFTNLRRVHTVELPDSIHTIQKDAFANIRELINVKFGSGLKEIGTNAFQGTGIKEVTLPADCRYYSNSFPHGTKVNGGMKIEDKN